MAISTRCSECGKAYHLSDDQAGERVRCRACRAEFDVPGRVETLEAVPRSAVTDRTVSPNSELYEPLARSQQPKKSRKWVYVLGGLAAVCLLVFLGCTGTVVVGTMKARQGFAKMQAQMNADVEAAKREAKQAEDRAEKERDNAKKERDDAKKERDQARIDAEKVAKAIIDGGNTGEIRLPKLPNVPDFDLPDRSPIKDLDDALARLKAKNWLTKQHALGWITENSPYQGEQKRRVLEALEPLTKDKDALVAAGATQTKLIVEQDL